jgi:hypothetical protein
VASGRRFEPPDYCEKNQSIKNASCVLTKHEANYFHIIHKIIDEYGVPNGRPPYAPVAGNIIGDTFTLIFIKNPYGLVPHHPVPELRKLARLSKTAEECEDQSGCTACPNGSNMP